MTVGRHSSSAVLLFARFAQENDCRSVLMNITRIDSLYELGLVEN